jgi:hypothetical protein
MWGLLLCCALLPPPVCMCRVGSRDPDNKQQVSSEERGARKWCVRWVGGWWLLEREHVVGWFVELGGWRGGWCRLRFVGGTHDTPRSTVLHSSKRPIAPNCPFEMPSQKSQPKDVALRKSERSALISISNIISPLPLSSQQQQQQVDQLRIRCGRWLNFNTYLASKHETWLQTFTLTLLPTHPVNQVSISRR